MLVVVSGGSARQTAPPAAPFAAYLGGAGPDRGEAIAVDERGNAYLLGTTSSPDFPAPVPLPASLLGELPQARFLLKFDPSGALIYTVPLPTTPAPPFDVAVDRDGAAYVLSGQLLLKFDPSGSRRLYEISLAPDVIAGFDVDPIGRAVLVSHSSINGRRSIVVRMFDSRGQPVYRRAIPGGRNGATARSIAVDAAGSVYIAGQTASEDFPTTAGTVQPRFNTASCVMVLPRVGTTTFTCPDVFVVKLDRRGVMAYSTYLGGTSSDDAVGLAVDGTGAVHVAGNTSSADFPLRNAFQTVCRRGFSGPIPSICRDAFVARLDPGGSRLEFSTFLGGSTEEIIAGVVVGPRGPVYVAGSVSPGDFPTTTNALQSHSVGGTDGFITAFASDGRVAWSTYFGGEREDRIEGLALGRGFRLARSQTGEPLLHVVGSTSSAGWSLARRGPRGYAGEEDVFWGRLP